jgi:hypothetical protein
MEPVATPTRFLARCSRIYREGLSPFVYTYFVTCKQIGSASADSLNIFLHAHDRPRQRYTRFLGNSRWIRTAAIATREDRKWIRTAAIVTREEVARLFRVVHDDIPSPRPSRVRNAGLLPKRWAPTRAGLIQTRQQAPLDKARCSGVTSNVISWAVKTPAG